ncbi:MAG: carbon storage regulator [Acidiferrobacterales bacterium]
MLILSRRSGEAFQIQPGPQIDPELPVAMLFERAPIEIVVTRILGSQVRLGISAHPQLIILRRELALSGQGPCSPQA